MARFGSGWVALAAGALMAWGAMPAAACEKESSACACKRSAPNGSSPAAGEEVAGKCACGGPSDCTCKKKDCQCGKCSKPKRAGEHQGA